MQATAGAVRLSGFKPRSAALLELTKTLAGQDRIAGGEDARHRFEAAEQATPVIDSHDAAVHHPPREADGAEGGRQHCVSRRGSQVNAAVAGKPALRRLVEDPENARLGMQGPYPPGRGWCRFGPA